MVKLGDRVRDVITGFEGVALSITYWLNGCSRVQVQPTDLKDGAVRTTEVFDEPQLVVIQPGAVAFPARAEPADPGGPRPTINKPEGATRP